MKKTLCILAFLLIFSNPVFAWKWGSGFNQGDLKLDKNSLDYDEKDSDPSAPASDRIKLYAKDKGGTTTLYTIDSASSVNELGAAGAGSGDAVTVAGTAVDTTANFVDTGIVDFTLTDGGGGGPDAIKGDIDGNSITDAHIGTNAVKADELDISDVSDNIAADIAEGELKDSIVISADIKDDTIDSDDYAAGSIDAEHLAADIVTHALMADSDQTDTKCIWFEDPVATDDFSSIWRNGTANSFLITEIWGESDQTVDFDLVEGAGDCGDPVIPAAGEDENTGLTCTISADEEIDLKVNSVTNAPTWVSICWTGNWVD